MDTKTESKHFFVSEIEAHEQHGDDWWNIKGHMRALHSMNKLRIPLVRKGLALTRPTNAGKQKFLEGLRVLDVGCGGGILTEELSKAGGEVTGVDPSEGLIKIAQNHAAVSFVVNSPTYICDVIENHAQKFPNYYDVVVASEVVEHVPNIESFLSACISALKPGGSLFVTTPNRTVLSWFGGIFVCEWVLRIVPVGFHSWSQFIHHSTLKELISKMGCEVQKVRGMFWDPLRNKWSWCFTPTFIYTMHSVKSAVNGTNNENVIKYNTRL